MIEESLTDEESLHLRYYKKTIIQLWLLVLTGILMAVLISVGVCRFLAEKDIHHIERLISESRCACKFVKVEATGGSSSINLSVKPDPIEQLARELLVNEGKLPNAKLPGSVRRP